MQNATRRPGTLTAAPPRRPMKPKAWNHQDDLLAMRGKLVRINFRDDTSTFATLLEADQFSIKVRLEDDQSILIVWKHDLSSIYLVPPKAHT